MHNPVKRGDDMTALERLRQLTISSETTLPFSEMLRLRYNAYMEHLERMTVPDPLIKWALRMRALHQTQDQGMRLKVWHLVLPNVPSSWVIALLIVRYGEALWAKNADGALTALWPTAFSVSDIRRAQEWERGETPAAVQYLTSADPGEAASVSGLGTLTSWALLLLGGVLSVLFSDSLSELWWLLPLVGTNMTDYMEGQMVTHLFRTGLTTVPAWAASTAYTVGDIVRPATWNNRLFQCVVAGTSGAAEPTWDTTMGNETVDNTVTWLAVGVGVPKRAPFFALFTAAPGETGGGTEVSGGGYARVKSIPSDANWTAVTQVAGKGRTDNAVDIVFPAPTANWGSITHMAIFSRATGGDMLFYGALTTAKTVNNGDPAPKFAVGDLDIDWA